VRNYERLPTAEQAAIAAQAAALRTLLG
jgi:hypothetical protein